MATLLIKSEGFDNRILQLNLGLNRLGRSPENHFQIEHPTVSAVHCEVLLKQDSVTVNDCQSTNGTFVDGQAVEQAELKTGQTLRLGDIELLVESTEVIIAIPKFDLPMPAPPVVLEDGALLCPRHPEALATHQCTHCHEVLCEKCLHQMRLRGGTVHRLCPLCSHECQLIGGEKPRKATLWGLLKRTVKIPFARKR